MQTSLDRARALLYPTEVRDSARTERGYLDVLGPVKSPVPTFAQRAMNNTVMAAVYERLWRPAWVAVTGVSQGRERARAVKELRLRGEQRVLDVACGPGNLTRHLGAALTGDGLAIGFDISEQMLAQAVSDNTGDRVAYVRGDARHLPFEDATFDAVCCYGALYLVPEPFTVLDELIRVVRPGGRIAVMASAAHRFPVARLAQQAVSSPIGVRTFARDAFTSVFEHAGLTEIDRTIDGAMQFVTATK